MTFLSFRRGEEFALLFWVLLHLRDNKTHLVINLEVSGCSDHPQENEMQKAKWLSEEALQIAMERREVKGKGEKERYNYLSAEFQRIVRRDKKAFLSDPFFLRQIFFSTAIFREDGKVRGAPGALRDQLEVSFFTSSRAQVAHAELISF